MRSFTFPCFAGALCLSAVFVWQAPAPAADDGPDPQNGVEAQARGPVHEAYAEPAETRPEPRPVVAKQPPDPIQEQPPDQKPAGDNIEWIPGYWGWDDETTDFTWISGFCGAPPPGREWTPGHWQEVDGGWQWVAGVWAAQDAQQLEYLPPPPPSIDNGPSVPATDETSAYVPGCWIYHETRYLWRPGYWVEANPNWCWIPDHYCWTPTGYLFVAGYWDYPLESRGLLFAPVRFERRVFEREDFVYVPQYVVQPDFLLGALFVRPAYGHYYFGDYFENRYAEHGFTSWVDYRVGRHSYDPNFAFYRRRYRDDDHWVSGLRELYALRRSGDAPRPPRTWAQQTQIVNNITVNKTQNVTINKNINITNIQSVTALTPIARAGNVRVTGLAGLTGAKPAEGRAAPAAKTITLEAVTKERQVEARQHVTRMREFSATQQKAQARILSSGTTPVKPTDRPTSVKVELPKNPDRPATPRLQPKGPAAPPPPPPAPKHEERPIPTHEPPRQSAPPRAHVPAPGPKEPTPPPRREPIPPGPAKEPAPPPPPRKEPPSVKEPAPPRREPSPIKEPPTPPRKEPAPPAKEPPPPPPRREPPAPPPAKEPPTPPPPRKEPPLPPAPRREPPAPPPIKEPPAAPPHREPPAPPPAPPRREPPAPPPPPRKEPPPPPPAHKEPPPPPAKDKPPVTKAGH